MQAYRDELAAARIRLEDALRGHEQARARVAEQLDAIAALNEQLDKRGLATAELPEVAQAPPAIGNVAELKLGDLVRHAGEVEDGVARLVQSAEDLSRLFSMLQDRVQGKNSALALGAPPRDVPFSYIVSEWFGCVCMFTKVSVLFPPVWAGPFLSIEIAAAMIVLFVLVATVRTVRRIGLLRWAKVATVSLLNEESSSTKNTNIPMRRASGWEVTTELYTGYTQKSRLRYLTEEGSVHELTVRGIGYEGGVVLYDSRKPTRAMAIEKFDCTPRPDYQGKWERRLSGKRVWVTTGLGAVSLAVPVVAIILQLA